jgi:hypothetical protein
MRQSGYLLAFPVVVVVARLSMSAGKVGALVMGIAVVVVVVGRGRLMVPLHSLAEMAGTDTAQ